MKLGNDMKGNIDGSFKINDPAELLVLITSLEQYGKTYNSDKADTLARGFTNVLKALTQEQR